MEMISLCTQFPLLLLLLNSCTVSPATQDNLVISTKNGKVQGKLVPVPGGNVRAFLGIPYGKPPVGTLRFRPPEQAETWQGVRDATRFPNTCYQMPDTSIPGFKGTEMWNPNTPVSEDCLYLNVWTPNFNTTQPPPPLVAVLVWIYGGGFVVGTSSLDIYDGRFLSKSENIVVVSMNYRLGALGFLSLPDNKNIKGNAGLLDQRLALKWVASNIGAFGGDPSKVTIFGESAGSLSVGLHLLSPGSGSLFHRAVMQSGSPNAFWGTISETEGWDRSLMLAKSLGCSTSRPDELEACLQKAKPDDITMKQQDVLTQIQTLALPFLPVVDGDFLPERPDVLLRTGGLPKKELVIGLNKDEGSYFLINVMPGFSINGQSLITREQYLQGVKLTMADSAEVTREAAVFHYTDWADANNSTTNRDLLSSLVGDQLFVCSALEFTHGYAKNGGKTFLYFFDHRSSVNPWPEWMGVIHGYELEFVFGMPLNASLGYTKNEVNMTKKIMKHWANFARTGNPSIDGINWPAFTAERQEYITLNYNQPEQRSMLRAKECQLWNKLLPDIQRTADKTQPCSNANGIIPSRNYTFILVLMATCFLFH